MTDHPDPVETLARALWKQSHTKPWDKWEGSSPEVRQSFVDGARALLAQITPAIVDDAVKAEREACANEAETEGWPGSMSAKHYDALTMYNEGEMDCAERIAAAIRARTP